MIGRPRLSYCDGNAPHPVGTVTLPRDIGGMNVAKGILTIKDASAKLPGSSSVALTGALTAQNGQPNFDGALKADSSNLRALIEAFAPGAVKDVPNDRLTKLALNTGVKYNPAQAELANLKATLDQSTLNGGVVVALFSAT